MKLQKNLVFLAVGFFLALGTNMVWGLDEVAFQAVIEKPKIKFGEKVQFLIIVQYGMNTMAPNITAPSFVQFNVLNENEVTKENGQGEEKFKILKHIWLLEPSETGRLSIASAIITYQDPTSNLLRNGKTDVVFIDVEPTEESKQLSASGAKGNTAPARGKSKGMWIGIGVGGSVVGLLVLLLLFSGGKKKTEVVPKASAEDMAAAALQAALDHAENENLDEYYKALSRTLLDYIQNKFALDADVLSSQALLEKLADMGVNQAQIAALTDFFQVADKAKFAGYVPDEEKMIALHGTVNGFIENGRKLKVKPVKTEKRKKTEDEDED